MKKFVWIIIYSLIITAIALTGKLAYGDNSITCPDGTSYTKEYIYAELVPEDFPEQLMSVFCFRPCVDITPMYIGEFPRYVIGMASDNGYCSDNAGKTNITWVSDTTIQRFVIFILYENKRHRILWISDVVSDDFREYIHGVVKESNRSGDITCERR